MSEETWHQARLIPTSGISGAEEQERRATSALLAVMSAVREFGRGLTQPLGAPAGTIETFIEVPFVWAEKKCFPDGLIRVTRGQKSWTSLVEVKTGTNKLATDQLETYLDVAREQGFDALVTISNETPAVAGQHPTKVDKRKLRKVALHHWSWSQVLSEAVMQKEHRGVADPDQAWILGELIRYLEHPRSGALEFEDMGQAWVGVRDAVAASTLRATDKAAPEVAARFDALLRYTSLRLGRRLGTDVTPALSRKELADPQLRAQALLDSLTGAGALTGAIRIPHTVGQLEVVADLRAGKVTCFVDVAAPREGRPATRVNWLVRQLKHAPETLRVEAFTAHARGASSAELLRAVRDNPAVLLTDPAKELRIFRVALDRPLGAKRGRGRGSFIDSVLDAVEDFYAEVMQHLKAWSAQPPKVRDTAEEPPQPVPPALVSTALSSQDGTEAVSDTDAPGTVTPVDGGAEEHAGHDDAEASPHHAGDEAGDEAPAQWAKAAADLAEDIDDTRSDRDTSGASQEPDDQSEAAGEGRDGDTEGRPPATGGRARP
jgi:hypothetical protein